MFSDLRRFVGFLALSLITTMAICQDMKFGRVSLDELKATHCPIDSAADAYVIGEYASSKFNRAAKGISMFLEATVRIKILKKSAFDHATVVIPGRKSTIEGLKAVTYVLENGQMVQDYLDNFEQIKQCHGIVLTGGEDIYPKYQVQPEAINLCNPDFMDDRRDEFEWRICEYVFENSVPVLGISRGLQLVNVFLGGTLILDISTAGMGEHSKHY